MRNIKLPKHPYQGLKIFCKRCRVDNPHCNHSESKVFRVRVHIPGSEKGIRSKMLSAQNYQDAVKESILFKKELEQFNYEPIVEEKEEGNDYSVVGAIMKFNQYLNGDSAFAHLKKSVSKGHKDEMVRFCRYFAESLKRTHNIQRMRIEQVSKTDVANFYTLMSQKYHPKTFNKCMAGLKYFFNFLIKIEEVEIKNPFETYESLSVPHSNIETLTKDEFLAILEAVDEYTPYKPLKTGEIKNMYFPWLKDAFKLFLFTGGRREEVVELKWGDLLITENGVKMFLIDNLKVNRNYKTKTGRQKVIPVTPDFEDFLIELGMNDNPNPNDYVLRVDRTQTLQTMMDRVSKAFTHYAEGAGINKNVSLRHSRKTYITWMNQAMGIETGKLTSQTEGVMKQYYIDPKVLSLAEKAAKEVKIFGEN
jgi:integrase